MITKKTKWYGYPGFESNLRFNKNGHFERLISGRWRPLNPSVNKGRKVLTFSTTINCEKIYCVVPNFIYNFFNPKANFEGSEIIYNDYNPNNCSIDNLSLLPIDQARDYVNRPTALSRISSFMDVNTPNFTIKDIKWVHDLVEKPSVRGGNPTIQYTSNYDRSDVLIYNTKTKIGDWVKYRTIMSGKNKNKEKYLNKIFSDRNLVSLPENFNKNRIYKTPENYPNIYLDLDNTLYLINDFCLTKKSYTDYQLNVPSFTDYRDRFSISPLEVINVITGEELRKDVHTFWLPSVIESRLKEISDDMIMMPTYSQFKNADSALFSHFTRNGGKKQYVELCEKLGLSFPVVFYDENGKDFDSEDEFRIFAILDFNGYKNGIDVFRQVNYPDDSGRTLDFEIKSLNVRLEFTGEVTDEAIKRINEKEVDSNNFGWDNLKIMKYISNEPNKNFVKRLSEVLGVNLKEPYWKFYYETYGYGVERLKVEIKKFLLSNYNENQTQNDLSKLNRNLMRWAQKFWGDFVNVLFQNGIEIKHRFRVTPEFLSENLDKVIMRIISDSGYLPIYNEANTDKNLSLQTRQFVIGIHKIFGKEFSEYDGYIYKKYSKYFNKPKQKPSKDYSISELKEKLSGFKKRSEAQLSHPGLYSYASTIGLIDELYPVI